jgi:hypothetical protein
MSLRMGVLGRRLLVILALLVLGCVGWVLLLVWAKFFWHPVMP